MSLSERREAIRKAYKSGLDAEKLKKDRQDNSFSLRKQKRFQNLQKRRNITSCPPDISEQVLFLTNVLFYSDPLLTYVLFLVFK